MIGLVLKKQADLFTVELENGNCGDYVARKVLKNEGIFVGDRVVVDESDAICKIEKRKNILIRPPLANIDKMFIVVAPIPKPDFYMVDKLIIFCILNNITPILCINKFDLDKDKCEEIEKIYKKVLDILVFSSFDKSVLKLKEHIKGICVLAGQSAVGKSSIINALKEEVVTKVDTFSKKIQRGKQTTRIVQLFKFGEDEYLADTAGFSKLDERLLNLKDNEVKNYFHEFIPYAEKCKYKTCLHKNSKECEVYKAVKAGDISEVRYNNYLKLLDTIKMLKKF